MSMPQLPRYDEEAFMHLKRPRVWPTFILWVLACVALVLVQRQVDPEGEAYQWLWILASVLVTGGGFALHWRAVSRQISYDNARDSYNPTHWG